MAQNVTIAGASYSDVPALVCPKTGGGTARFSDASETTAVESDVTSGKRFLGADGEYKTGSASGGGGASNLVTGTFKGTTTGAAMDVTLNYSGSGYPIAIVVFPTEGSQPPTTGTFGNISRYAISQWTAVKFNANTTPTYPTGSTGDENYCSVAYRYKNSTSDATSYTGSTTTSRVFRNADASNSAAQCVKIKSAKVMSVFIGATGNYGFPANIEYRYIICYSS